MQYWKTCLPQERRLNLLTVLENQPGITFIKHFMTIGLCVKQEVVLVRPVQHASASKVRLFN